MVSAAEQLAANINWSAFGKADELKKRIWFTLGALIIYRLGTYIPLARNRSRRFRGDLQRQQPGRAPTLQHVRRRRRAAHGDLRPEHHALYLRLDHHSALDSVFPTLEALKKEGESGPQGLNQYTRYLTVVLAAFQAYGIAIGLQGQAGVVSDPGFFFRLSTTLTLMGGTMFLMWLGEQITSRGIGNGSSLIIFAGIVAAFPSAIVHTLELGRQGAALDLSDHRRVMVMAVCVVGFIVFMERAQRRLVITYPKRQQGNRVYEGQTSFLPLKLNTSGVIPPIFASSLLLLPTTIANFSQQRGGTGILGDDLALSRPRPSALYDPLCRADRLLRVFLYRDRLQPDGNRRQSEEARRVHSRDPAGRAHGAIYRQGPDADHGDRRSLSQSDLSLAAKS